MQANKTIRILILIAFVSFHAAAQSAKFPTVSAPVQITSGKEHLFARYYGINSWSKNERYATVLETDVRDRIPTIQDTATLGLVDMRTNKFIKLAKNHCLELTARLQAGVYNEGKRINGLNYTVNVSKPYQDLDKV